MAKFASHLLLLPSTLYCLLVVQFAKICAVFRGPEHWPEERMSTIRCPPSVLLISMMIGSSRMREAEEKVFGGTNGRCVRPCPKALGRKRRLMPNSRPGVDATAKRTTFTGGASQTEPKQDANHQENGFCCCCCCCSCCCSGVC
uniref:Putative secreted protein n=1 Tax=Anopheles marajoara TaxID=58244 RepID=A0A2M4C6P2_9DIPT